jgi:putative ATPase
LEDLKGQHVLRSSGLFLPNLIASQKIPNMIFFGPPGSGKTSAARMIGNLSHLYFEYSATIHHLQDIRQGVEKAIKHLLETGQKGVIFIDEIHRFSKAQQDVFLQSVERGEYIFLAATTENPSFRVNNALLSRCRVYPFQKLDVKDIMEIIDRGITFLLPTPSDQISDLPLINSSSLFTDDMKTCIAAFSDGDGRVALNALEQLWYTFQAAKTPPSLESIKKSLTRSGTLYDRDGEEHYNIISALHKSMRGSDENAALYWLGRMIYAGEDPLYVARRLIRFASEDIGLANNQALDLAVSTYQSCQMIGMPECDVILAHCVAYLAQSPKSVQVYKAMKKVKLVISQESNYPVPLHLRNAPTPLMKDLDYGKGYKYNPDYQEPVQQTYLPPALQTKRFFE